MKIGFIGLGRMGGNMVERLLNHGHEIVGFARHEESRAAAREKGATTTNSLEELVDALEQPRIVWCMVPAGKATDETIKTLSALLSPGDMIIDGGNSNYQDSITHAQLLQEKNIDFLDAGTSGGIWGLKIGYCLMVGGKPDIFKKAEPLFAALAPQDGYAHVGDHGAGHYVKMIHNGIEYGLLQAYGEGFEILHAKKEFDFDLQKISHLWNQGSVVRSWLLELAEQSFKREKNLESVKGYVEDSGEGRWSVAAAINENVPAPIITLSLMERFHSRQTESFSAKVIAALRNEFGGHPIKNQ